MAHEAYCSYEVAKLLKEKGFDEPCRSHYIDYEDYVDFTYHNDELTDLQMGVWETLRPTHQMACAWLRKKGYHIAVLYQSKFRTWERIIQVSTGVKWSFGGFDSYDEAVENGIKYTLENLI